MTKLTKDEAPARRLLAMVQELLSELSVEAVASMDCDFERSLGLGSLEKAELMTRVETGFEVALPDSVLIDACTPRQLLRALAAAAPAGSQRFDAELDGQVLARTESVWRVPGDDEVRTLVDILRYRAENDPDAPQVHLLDDDGKPHTLSYKQVWDKGLRAAGGLATRGLERGERVALILPTGEDFLVAFVGILAAGGVPVPIYPPLRMDQLGPYLERHSRILSNAGTRFVLTDKQLLTVGNLLRDRVSCLRQACTVASLDTGVGFGAAHVGADDLGLIQYTSGSTGDPKGVALRHRNLIANMRANGRGSKLNEQDVCVSWLPLYHDMGLIGSWLSAVLYRVPLVLLSPLQFLSRPERWLWAFHRFKGSVSPAPNFGYELCVRKIPEAALEGLDLSTWRVAMNGSEPVRPETIDRFCKRFGPHGFRRAAMMPVYGMAETTVGLAFPPPDREPRIDVIERDRFITGQRAVPLAAGSDLPSLACVSVGKALEGHQLKLVETENPGGPEVGERCEGRILFRGPSSMRGYFNREEATQAVRFGDWTDTGDLGYLADGELYITGRVKDLVIKGGRNYHPQDIEQAAWTVDGVRKGCVVAFAAPSDLSGEAIVVVSETRAAADRHEDIRRAVSVAVQEAIGTPADKVVLVPPGTIPKTSSGKLRRRETRQMFLAGTLGRRRKPWLELSGIALRAVFARAWDGLRALGSLLYGLYATSVSFCVMVAMLLVIMIFCHSERSAWWVARLGSRLVFLLSGIPVRRTGVELPAGQALIVSNHGTYLDPLFLIMTLERPVIYTPKAEAFGWLLFGTAFRRLGCVPIERAAGRSSLASYSKAAEQLDKGKLVHIFPEGTFTEATGVRPFRLGAFRLAAEKGLPVVPIALRGARQVYRADWSRMRWGRVEVEVLPSLPALENPSLRDVARQRDTARKLLAEASHEPLLEITSAALPPDSTGHAAAEQA